MQSRVDAAAGFLLIVSKSVRSQRDPGCRAAIVSLGLPAHGDLVTLRGFRPLPVLPLMKTQARLCGALFVLTALFLSHEVCSQEGDPEFELDPLVVLADRNIAAPGQISLMDSAWTKEEITSFAPRTIDEFLSQDLAFGLYERKSFQYSHPSAHGVSLRDIAPNGAARTLVLRDGIPQNDPFGGWVRWGRYDSAAMKELQILSSSQSAAWGNQSVGGVILMTSLDVGDEVHRFELSAGDAYSFRAATHHTLSRDNVGVYFGGNALTTEGYYIIHPDDRGPVDERIDLESYTADTRVSWQATDTVTLEAAYNWYREHRSTGSPLEYSDAEAWDLSFRARGGAGELNWDFVAYFQDTEMATTFTAINGDRTQEFVVRDQYLIPAEGLGASFTGTMPLADGITGLAGMDYRRLEGETREDGGPGLNSRLIAGGTQYFFGAFAKVLVELAGDSLLQADARFDWWKNGDGSRIEFLKSTGQVLRQFDFEEEDAVEPSLSVSYTRPLGNGFKLNLGASYAFRLPNLNEYYRPFRIGNDIFEANESLTVERYTSVEGSIQWIPNDRLSAMTGLYQYWIEDTVANVFLFAGPGTTPQGVPVPPDGTFNQRQNVDRAETFGWQTRIDFQATDMIRLNLIYLYTDARFTESSTQPELAGARFPNIPYHRFTLSASVAATEKLSLGAAWDYGGETVDLAGLGRPIEEFTSLRLLLGYRLNNRVQVNMRLENALDEIIHTGQASPSAREIQPPRHFWMTVSIDL